MGAQTFDFTKVFAADLPSPSGKWTGLAKFNFTGGNNDPPQIPLDELVAAANNVLRREGRNLAVYNLGTGPQGYVPLRDFMQGGLAQAQQLITDSRQLIIELTRVADQLERDPTRFLFGDRREGYRPR